MDTYDAHGRRLDEPDEPRSHYHLVATDVGVVDDVDNIFLIPMALARLQADYGARQVTVKYCWGFRCSL